MNITIKATRYELIPATESLLREKLSPVERLLGKDAEQALLELEIEDAPAEGRSSEPSKLVARLVVGGEVYYAEAVKPTPESAADRVRSELESEIRKSRGRARKLWKRGGAAIKEILRFGR